MTRSTITFWVTGFVFVAINLFMAYAVVRYRHRKGRRAAYEPENKKLEWWLTGLTTVGVVAMLAPGLFVWAKFVEVPKDAAVIRGPGPAVATGAFAFPGRTACWAPSMPGYISDKNPFGINPDDPDGQDDVLVASQEVHLPIGKPVKVLLRSIDVLHDFAVPQFRAKMDLVPGLVTYVWFTPTRTGKFDAPLRTSYVASRITPCAAKSSWKKRRAFQAWLSGHPTFAQSSAGVAGDAAAGEPLYAVCAACHGAQAEGNPALNAPKLSGQGDWYLQRQLKNFKKGARGTHDKDVFGKMMAPMAATLADDAAIDNVVAYIRTLPDNPAPATVKGMQQRSRGIMTTCGACHGANGQGMQATNAPRLKGMSDWYMVTQLKNFKHGIRGAHPQDMYGPQMGIMAAMLTDDQAINDLVAYINTL